MEKFIRLDMKGHWRGTEHCSMFGDATDTVLDWNGDELVEHPCGEWEPGISCYRLGCDFAYALENLRYYWVEIAGFRTAKDYADMQVTVFEGERIGEGSDGEDTAICHRTLFESDAEPFMSHVLRLYEMKEYEDELSEEEYMQKLCKFADEYIFTKI